MQKYIEKLLIKKTNEKGREREKQKSHGAKSFESKNIPNDGLIHAVEEENK